MVEPNNTHTLYTHYTRLVKKANEDIAQTAKYLEPNSPHYMPTYLANLEALKNSAQPPEGIDAKIATMREHYASYQARAAAARAVLQEYPPKIKALESANEVFLAPPQRQDDYLYVIDEESCKASCIDWEHVAANPGHEISVELPEQYYFKGKAEAIELYGNQTDVLRVWYDHVTVENVSVVDQRADDVAHRDAIQLIPPPLGKYENNTYIRLADQMAGTIQTGVTVRHCVIKAPNGPLQGIFSSDGMQRCLKILDNQITTKGSHAISLAGVLDGSEISGNTLYEVAGGELPRIRLFPARIGGNMADDGVVCILGFAPETEQTALDYAPVLTQAPNQRVRANGQVEPLAVEDIRRLIPDNFLRMGVGLADFNYHAYLADYSSLTLAQYREWDPFGAQRLEAWLRLRTEEFAKGRAEQDPLGQPGAEQKQIGERFLAPALKAWQDGSIENQRLVDLEQTAIRSFAMKRLAILHGQCEALIDIALQNPRREAMLKFLLPAEFLANTVRIAVWEAAFLCARTRQPIAQAGIKLFFEASAIFTGHTDAQGKITLHHLPLAPCILEWTDHSFALATDENEPASVTSSLAQTQLAQSLLADFRRKIAVVEAYLAHDPSQEARCITAIERQLSLAQVDVDTAVTEQVRKDCLQAIGLTESRRDPYRALVSFWVQCPVVEVKPAIPTTVEPTAKKLGCLLFILTALLRFLGGLSKKNKNTEGDI